VLVTNKSNMNPAIRILSLTFVAIVFASFGLVGRAQGVNRNMPSASSGQDDKDDDDMPRSFEDMLARRRIELAKKEYEENLSRAREAVEISTTLKDTFQDKSGLDQAGVKKLERIEKLTKKIREQAGGSESDDTGSSLPHDLRAALAKLNDSAISLRDTMEKTPRHVVSFTVIERANEVLDLVKLLKNNPRF
jgi:hypothetical protein